MKSIESVDSHIIFDSFDTNISIPEQLTIEPSGFLADDNHVYAFRRSAYRPAVQMGTELYNGKRTPTGARPRFQATEGHGLYITNSPAATDVPGIYGDTMYALRIPKNGVEWLDSHNTSNHDNGQRIAAGLHRLRGSMIGVPNPGPRGWDTLYGSAEVVSFAPMALARLIIGRTVELGDIHIKPRWAVVRNPDTVQVLGQRAHKK